MKKRIIIVLVILTFLLLSIVYYFVVSGEQPATSESGVVDTDEVTAFPQDAPQDGGQAADPVTVRSGRDFLRDEDVGLWFDDPDTYLVEGGESVEGVQFQTFYFPNDDSITISLSGDSLAVSRRLAEAALIERLALPEDVLCALPINVTAPSWESEVYSGVNLGLSFCPGSVAL